MDFSSTTFLLSSILTVLSFLFLLGGRSQTRETTSLPPGPPAWPIVGHTFSLGSMPHRFLAGLKQQYGPVIWLKIGSVNTMVILSAKAASELFKNHDLAFADRTITDLIKSNDYHKGSLGLAPYGPHWRVLRRICTVEMMVAKRINQTAEIRRRSIDNLFTWIEKEVSEKRAVHVAKFVLFASFNMLGNLMLSKDLLDPESSVRSEFFVSMISLMEWTAHPNISDLFPWLSRLDLQGLRKKMDRHMGKAIEIALGFVQDRVKERENGGERKRDFLEVLLEFRGIAKDEPEKLTDHDIIILILELFQAGTETTSSTTEWAMTELLCHPEKMTKVKTELSLTIGPDRKFEESDIDNLPYLHAVIQETLRLHPPIPFLLPRNAIHDIKFMGYHIPKNTQLFVNAWAIGRDEECWDDPSSFNPERFLGSKVDYKGQYFEFLPFGAGRRMCAGLPLGHRMGHLVLGSLLHGFDWKLEDNVSPDTMDMSDKLGVTVRKLEPLKAIATKLYTTT